MPEPREVGPRPVDCGHEAQGLKPAVILVAILARLKSRPDTGLMGNFEWGLVVASKLGLRWEHRFRSA